METTQGTSLCSSLYLKLAKMSCFSFYLLCFFLYKIREQEGGTGSTWGGGLGGGTGGMEDVVGKGAGGWIWCKQCIHVYVNAKMIPVETSRNLGRVDGKEKRRGGFKYDIFDTL
jgi:hypothetical protein